MLVYNLENEVLIGNKEIVKQNLGYLNDTVQYLLNKDVLNDEDIRILRATINIFNTIYNNS